MKTIKIGLDLDGVISRHTFGGFWFRLRKIKEKLLKKAHDSSYYYPKTWLERAAWLVIDWFRPPLREKDLFCSLARKKKFQFFLITGRFQFLERLTQKWLKKYQLFDCFEKIFLNKQRLDPREFKAKKINQLGLDFFLDDDLETVLYLRKKTSAKIFLQKSSPSSLVEFCQSWSAD